MIEPFSEPQSDTPAALAPCSSTPSTLTITPSTIANASSLPKRDANTREAEDQRASEPATAVRAGSHAKNRNDQATDHQRERQVVQPAHDTEGDLGDLAALVLADQAGDRELRRRARRGRC